MQARKTEFHRVVVSFSAVYINEKFSNHHSKRITEVATVDARIPA